LSGKANEAFTEIEKSIQLDPTNANLYLNKGILAEQLNKPEEAELAYKKAIELNAGLFDAQYNLGTFYYNQGVEMNRKANDIKDNKKYEAAKKQADILKRRQEMAYNNVKAVYDTTITALDNPKYSKDKDAKVKACNDLIWTIVSGAPKNEKVNWAKLKTSYDWDELNEFGMMDEIENTFANVLKIKDTANESVNEEHDCGCNENHDCGCGGVHEHIHEDLSADANGIAGLTASRANAVKDFLEKHNINSNKLYLSLKKGGLKDRMDFVTALVGKPGNPIQKKVISQFSN
jgi:uncharacterized protein (DUF2164 family)